MSGIDPKWGAYLGLAVIIEQGIGHGTVSLTNLIPADWAPYVTSWANFLAFVGTSIMTYQAAVSGPQKGPLADTPMSPAAKLVIVMAVLGAALFALPQGAMAQGVQRKLPTINLPIDPLHLNGTAVTGDPNVDLKAIWDKIVKASDADLSYASALAATAGTPAAKQRKQCWDAITALNQQANGTNLKNADGTAMVRPDAHLFSDIESQAEIIDNLSPQGQLFTSCAGAAEMAKMNVLQFVSAVVTGAAGFAAIP